jgi:hypothetical protein
MPITSASTSMANHAESEWRSSIHRLSRASMSSSESGSGGELPESARTSIVSTSS